MPERLPRLLPRLILWRPQQVCHNCGTQPRRVNGTLAEHNRTGYIWWWWQLFLLLICGKTGHASSTHFSSGTPVYTGHRHNNCHPAEALGVFFSTFWCSECWRWVWSLYSAVRGATAWSPRHSASHMPHTHECVSLKLEIFSAADLSCHHVWQLRFHQLLEIDLVTLKEYQQ